MQTIPEQMSTAGRAQIQAQLELFGSIASAAIENTGKLALLQLNATREVIDRSGAAWFQLLSLGPNNFLDLASKTQTDLSGMIDAARAPLAAFASLPPAFTAFAAFQPPAPEAQPREQALEQQAESHSQHTENVLEQPEPAAHAHGFDEPPAARTPIAEAAAQVAPDGEAVHPVAAIPEEHHGEISLPRVEPLESAPPPPHRPHEHGGRRKGVPRK